MADGTSASVELLLLEVSLADAGAAGVLAVLVDGVPVVLAADGGAESVKDAYSFRLELSPADWAQLIDAPRVAKHKQMSAATGAILPHLTSVTFT
jgi:hypothetical protein